MPYKTFQIDGIGDVIITKHARSKNIRIRIIGSRVKVSVPRWVPYKYALKYTEQKKLWIKENIKQKSFFYSGAKIGKHCLVGAGALVTEGKEFPDGSMIIGSPAKAVKTLTPGQMSAISEIAGRYVKNAQRYAKTLKKIS